MPVDGSAPATTALRVPLADGESGIAIVSGSSQRAAAVVAAGPKDHGYAQVFSGPPSGPLTALGPPVTTEDDAAFWPIFPFVEGDRLLVAETDNAFAHARVREGEGTPVEIPGAGTVMDLAGDLAAIAQERRLVVRDWRTGAERAVTLPDKLDSVDLCADGTAVAGMEGGGIYTISPAGAVRRVSRTGDYPRFAGDRIVYAALDGLMLASPHAQPRPFGPRTDTLGVVDADARHVTWEANDCLLAADVATPASATPPAGRCGRTEVARGSPNTALRRDGTVPVVIRCLAAVHACRGTLRLSVTGRDGSALGSTTVRFRIRVGERSRLKPRLGSTLVRRVKRSGWGSEVPFAGRIVTVDPDGRRKTFHAPMYVTVR